MKRLEEFDILCGFKLLKVYMTEAKCSDGTTDDVMIMTFVNDKHVAVDVVFIDGEYQVTEPYAVNYDFEPVDKVLKG